MGRSLETYDEIAIAEIAIYGIFIFPAAYLCYKHGLARSSGWRFLLILCLIRIIGSGMRLGTINDPTNTNLYIGWQVLNGLGLGPLILMLLGLLSRVFESINRHRMVVKPMFERLVTVLMLVAMILLIVGGTQSSYSMNGGKPKIEYSGLSKGGIGVMIAVLAFVVLESVMALIHQGYIAQGEHRILIAVFASLPFVIVRLAYACVLVLGNLSGSAWLYLGAGVIMEMVVLIICEIVGLTLAKAPPKTPRVEREVEAGPEGFPRH